MARKKLFTLDLSGQATKMESVTVYLDSDGKATNEDKAVKTVESSVKILDGIGSIDLASKIFGGVDSLLKYLVSKINTQITAEHKLMIVNREAGPEKIIAGTLEKLRKAGTPEETIQAVAATLRAQLVG